MLLPIVSLLRPETLQNLDMFLRKETLIYILSKSGRYITVFIGDTSKAIICNHL